MSSHLTATLALLGALLCCLCSLAAAQPGIVLTNPAPAYMSRQYSTCAVDYDAIGRNSSSVGMWVIGGGYWYNTFDYSTTGVFSSSTAMTNVPATLASNSSLQAPLGRLASSAVYIPIASAQGNLLVIGGKTAPSAVLTNDVWFSQDLGMTWTQSTAAAAFAGRSDATIAVSPYTQTVVLAGGVIVSNPTSTVATNDVWLNTDGVGQVWTLQGNVSSAPFTDSAMVFLYDQPATLVLMDTANQAVYLSVDIGKTWTGGNWIGDKGDDYTGAGWATGMVADSSNNLYVVGHFGQVAGYSEIWFSSDKAQTWSFLPQMAASAAATSLLTLWTLEYACLGIIYTPTAGSTNLVIFGGLDLQALPNTVVQTTGSGGLNTSLWCPADSSTQATPQQFASIMGEVLYPGQQTHSVVSAVPSSVGGQPVVAFHDAASEPAFSYPYPTCGYDVHALLNATLAARPGMWQLGGFFPNYSWSNLIQYTDTGSWTSFQTFTSNAPGKVAGAAGLLANGLLLYFGGKDPVTGVNGTNDVWSSSNNGATFSLATAAAPWTLRSDLSFAFLPGTNTVMIMGGANTGGGGTLTDCWYSSDGLGVAWTQATSVPVGPFSASPAVALYDAGAGGQQYGTVLLAPSSSGSVWSSTNLGASWTAIAAIPWSSRSTSVMSADTSNFVYFTGGAGGNGQAQDGTVWWSWNKGVSWAALAEAQYSSVWPNAVDFLGANNNCQSIRYVPGSGAHFQLILYGGASTITSVSTSSCTTSANNVIYADVLFPATVTCITGGACSSVGPPSSSSAGLPAPSGSSSSQSGSGSSASLSGSALSSTLPASGSSSSASVSSASSSAAVPASSSVTAVNTAPSAASSSAAMSSSSAFVTPAASSSSAAFVTPTVTSSPAAAAATSRSSSSSSSTGAARIVSSSSASAITTVNGVSASAVSLPAVALAAIAAVVLVIA